MAGILSEANSMRSGLSMASSQVDYCAVFRRLCLYQAVLCFPQLVQGTSDQLTTALLAGENSTHDQDIYHFPCLEAT